MVWTSSRTESGSTSGVAMRAVDTNLLVRMTDPTTGTS
jgi:hypothetical protein